MWALGVVLYTMLYGQFPFYDSIPHELFRKIKTAEFLLPKYVIHLKGIFTFDEYRFPKLFKGWQGWI